ncbi:MAG: S8 family serine peptidase, partial [Mogibacterium sp.]|nr:S8 family serine peptidase [Mogibacterium sp.]
MLLFGPAAFAEDGEVVVAETNGDYAEYSLDVADLSSEALEESDSAEEALCKRLLIVGDDGLDLTGLEGVSSIVSSSDGLYVAQFDDASAADAAFDRLSSWSSVYSVEYDTSVESINSHHMNIASVSSSAKHLSWGANFIGADNYISRIKSTGSRRVVIAVVDSGVDISHSFLSSRMIRGFNFVDNNSNTSDVNGHGTHVAGIIADCTLGVNGISIMPVRALEENGYGEVSAIGSSLLYACDNGADIINFSVGGPRSSYLEAVVKRIIKRDVALVAASGNEASDIEYIGSCPAYIDEVITVGAVRRDNRVEQFSNYGRKLDFMAPGSAINSSVPNGKYAVYSGTSMAAPHVAASIALLEMEYGNLSNSTIESLLKRSCRKYPDTSLYGNGIIDLKNLAASISGQKIEISNKSYVYSGKANKPKVKVSRNGQSLFSGSDYSVSYSNNTNVGTAKVVVRGKG